MEVIAECKLKTPAYRETKFPKQYRPELLLPQPQKKENGEIELSLYEGNLATEDDINNASTRLSWAFPRMMPQFYALLTEFIKKDRFTAKRLEDAVNHVIANFQYKELNISDVIRFDRRIKLYTGREYENAQVNGADPSEFERRTINGVNYFIRKSETL